MPWHNKLTISGIVTAARVHCYRLPDSDPYRACKIAQFLLKFAEKTVLSLCADYLGHLTSDNRRVSTNRKPKIVLCNGQPFKASILLLTETYEYKFERFPFLSTSEAWAAGVRTDRNKGICYDNNNHSYHNNRVLTENDKNRTTNTRSSRKRLDLPLYSKMTY